MRNYQNEDEFKVRPANLDKLLRRLELAKLGSWTNNKLVNIIDKIYNEVKITEIQFRSFWNWDREVASCFQRIQRYIDEHFNSKTKRITVRDLEEALHKLQCKIEYSPVDRTKAFDLPHDEVTINETGETSNIASYEENKVSRDPKDTIKTRNYQNEDEFKVRPANLKLLRSLELAKDGSWTNNELVNIIDKIYNEVRITEFQFRSFWNWDREVASCIQRIERHIDNLIQDFNSETEWFPVRDLEEALHELKRKIEYSPVDPTKAFDLPHDEVTINETGETSNIASYQENKIPMELIDFFPSLDPKKMRCLYSLILFPENTELKKKLVIYWWIGLGLTEPFTGDTSRIESCELFFSNLVEMGVLIPKYKDRCIIKPTIHKLLGDRIRSAIRAEGTFQLYDWDNTKVLLNLDQKDLNSEEISKIHDLWVVQLGILQCQETEFIPFVDFPQGVFRDRGEINSRIKVDETKFLKKLGENVTYLSLRGILEIEELPESIGKLEKLMILDLNDCPHLEKLPQKPRSKTKQKLIRWAVPQVSWFKNLVVLDISGCFLLDHHMPKWIYEISNLEVLKGFIVGSVENNNQFCELGDISKLNKLRKLSIRIVTNIKVDLSVLQPLDRLLVLTIIWEGNRRNNYISTSSLPENIEKLDIRCYPESEASELLNPAKLKNLKRLYIRGGKLASIPCEDNWKVEILRLRFLQNLEYPTWKELKFSFKNLRYVEYVKCPRVMLRGLTRRRN